MPITMTAIIIVERFAVKKASIKISPFTGSYLVTVSFFLEVLTFTFNELSSL